MNNIMQILQQNPVIFIIIVGIISLSIGSFLNVIIVRLPIMMEKIYTAQCEDFLSIKKHDFNKINKEFNLFLPGSHCPKCKHKISIWENLPILSFVFLKGKCRYCKSTINIRYPLIEILTTFISMLIAWNFSLDLKSLYALLLILTLLVQATIDLEHTFIPDEITIPAIWVGLLINCTNTYCNTTDAILGAIIGYLSLWSVYWIFKIITKKEGMGYGDFKLLAMLGAWLGWQQLPLIIIVSSLLGSIVGITLIVIKNKKLSSAIPFGPYLAIAGIISILYGSKINTLCLQYLGLF